MDKSQFNPKLGLIWNPVPDTTLRFAAFRTLKRALLSDQTVEPTQVAGFAQFFDDLNATDAKRYGAALDQRLGKTVWGGLEISHRDLTVIPDILTGIEEQQRESLARTYLYWTISPRVVFGTEYFLEIFDREFVPVVSEKPKALTTHRLPLALSYFHPAGWITGLKLTPVIQKAVLPDGFGGTYRDDDRFWVTDASVGYRLPARRGLVSVGVRNLFDREFRYQDTNFQTNEPRLPLYQPERTVFARLTLVF
jgi:outer membrane receptor protein involved in Fe transport